MLSVCSGDINRYVLFTRGCKEIFTTSDIRLLKLNMALVHDHLKLVLAFKCTNDGQQKNTCLLSLSLKAGENVYAIEKITNSVRYARQEEVSEK